MRNAQLRNVPRLALASVVALGLSLAGAVVASAAQIESPTGPLTQITISPDLNCDVRYLGDEEPEFYNATACATLVSVEGVLYGPAAIPAGQEAAPRTDWTPVAQTQGGAGTSTDPYWINTTVTGGDLTVTQRDTYVGGSNSYQTSVTLSGATAADAIIYHGADCYLQDSDDGFGSHDPVTGAVTCRAPDENSEFSTETRIEEFIPRTSGSDFLYDSYSQVWAAIGSQQPLSNEVNNGQSLNDNGMALSWSVNVPAGGSASVSMLTNFSTIGLSSLTTSIAPNPNALAVGQQTEVTATVTNPNLADQTLSAVTVAIPAGTTYVPGSTSGASEPTVSGSTLTFTDAGIAPGDAALGFTFKLEGISQGAGTLTLEGVTASGAPVLGSTASLTVGTGDVPDSVEVSPTAATVVQGSCPTPGNPVGPSATLPENTADIVYSLAGDVVADSTVTVTATAQASYLFPVTVPGWTVSTDRMTATMSVQLAPNSCDPAVVTQSVAPVAPKVVQATCTAGPSVTLANTEGIQHGLSPQNPKAGQEVTVTAKALEGFVLVAAEGWTLDRESGISTWSKTLAAKPADCMAIGLPKTGADFN